MASWPGLSRPSTPTAKIFQKSLAVSARTSSVDGRVKPGHDEGTRREDCRSTVFAVSLAKIQGGSVRDPVRAGEPGAHDGDRLAAEELSHRQLPLADREAELVVEEGVVE